MPQIVKGCSILNKVSSFQVRYILLYLNSSFKSYLLSKLKDSLISKSIYNEDIAILENDNNLLESVSMS